MKSRDKIVAVFMAVCMILSMTPLGVFADQGDEQQYEWRYEDAVEVTTSAELAAALPSGESDPDGNNIIWIKCAKLASDITMDTMSVETLGKLIVPAGRTLTLNNAQLECELYVEHGGTVKVLDGSTLATTMAGENAIMNHGSIYVDEPSWMTSQKGGHIVNAQDGFMDMRGTMYVACFHNREQDEDVVWFKNEGTIEGFGSLTLYDIVQLGEVDMDAAIEYTMAQLGQQTRFDNWDDIDIKKEVIADDEDALIEAMTAERTVAGEPVEGNSDTIIIVNTDMTLEGEELDSMATLVVNQGQTLRLVDGTNLTCGLWNKGEFVVEEGCHFGTTQGGGCGNEGSFVIAPGAEAETQMGTNFVNLGNLFVDGVFAIGGVIWDDNGTETTGTWFENNDTVSGTGWIVAKNLENAIDEEDPDRVDRRFVHVDNIKKALGSSTVPVLMLVWDGNELKEAVETNGQVATADGFALLMDNATEDNYTQHLQSSVDMGDLTLVLLNSNLLLDPGVSLKVKDVDHLMTYGFGACVQMDKSSGSLYFGSDEVVGGMETTAALTLTDGDMYVTQPAYVGARPYPVNWLFLQGEAYLNGNIDEDDFELIADGKLIVDKPAQVGKVEVRGEMIVNNNGELTARDIDYGRHSYPHELIEGTNSTTYELAFDLNDGSEYPVIAYVPQDNGKIFFERNDIPYEPTRSGYTFSGWEFTSPWREHEELWTDEMTEAIEAMEIMTEGEEHYVTESDKFPVMLVAQWDKNSSGSHTGGGKTTQEPEEPEPTDPGTTEPEPTEPEMVTVEVTDPVTGEVTQVEVTKAAADAAEKFDDVNPTDWFAESVGYAIEHNFTAGTGERTFSPNVPLTRGMMAQMLYSIDGTPQVDGKSTFTDIKDADWYSDAVAWMQKQGLSAGYGERFGAEDNMTREQMVAMLYAYAKMHGYAIVEGADLSGYEDADQISSWATEAMAWAKAAGLVSGRTATKIAPTGNATRAETMTILMNFMKLVAKSE